MKPFILRFSIFILPILLLLIPADFFLSGSLKKSKTYVDGEYMVWNDIYSGKIDEDIVIYGASRAMVHFNPEILEDSLNRSCYNLGINGLEFWHIYLRHRELLKYNKPPKYIIISVDVFTFGKGKNLYNEDQFLPYMLGNENIRKYLSTVGSFNFLDYFIPLIRYQGRRYAIKQAVKSSLLGEYGIPTRIKGFTAMKREWNDDFDNARAKFANFEINLDPASVSLFNDFLSECQTKNIKVIFVYTPEYIEGQTFVKNRNEIIKIFIDYSNKYNILFLDYSKDAMCLKKEYFYNANHLNKAGSEIFTAKLIRDLKESNLKPGIYLSGEKKNY